MFPNWMVQGQNLTKPEINDSKYNPGIGWMQRDKESLLFSRWTGSEQIANKKDWPVCSYSLASRPSSQTQQPWAWVHWTTAIDKIRTTKVTQSLFIYRHAALHVYHWAAVLRLTMWSLSAISPTRQPPWTKKGHPPKISWTSLRYIKCNAHIVKKAKAQHCPLFPSQNGFGYRKPSQLQK